MKRLTLCLLALFLVVSAISATAHGVVHQDNGYEQCLLCASHADAKPPALGAGFIYTAEDTTGRVPQAAIEPCFRSCATPLPQPRAPPGYS
jgi:hypothetical protein